MCAMTLDSISNRILVLPASEWTSASDMFTTIDTDLIPWKRYMPVSVASLVSPINAQGQGDFTYWQVLWFLFVFSLATREYDTKMCIPSWDEGRTLLVFAIYKSNILSCGKFTNMDTTLHNEHGLPTRHSLLESSANIQLCGRLFADIENNGQIS